MKIAIDLQGIQSKGSRSRGIGRYSLELVRNIIYNAKNHDIYLVANAVLQDVRVDFERELELKNEEQQKKEDNKNQQTHITNPPTSHTRRTNKQIFTSTYK